MDKEKYRIGGINVSFFVQNTFNTVVAYCIRQNKTDRRLLRIIENCASTDASAVYEPQVCLEHSKDARASFSLSVIQCLSLYRCTSTLIPNSISGVPFPPRSILHLTFGR